MKAPTSEVPRDTVALCTHMYVRLGYLPPSVWGGGGECELNLSILLRTRPMSILFSYYSGSIDGLLLVTLIPKPCYTQRKNWVGLSPFLSLPFPKMNALLLVKLTHLTHRKSLWLIKTNSFSDKPETRNMSQPDPVFSLSVHTARLKVDVAAAAVRSLYLEVQRRVLLFIIDATCFSVTITTQIARIEHVYWSLLQLPCVTCGPIYMCLMHLIYDIRKFLVLIYNGYGTGCTIRIHSTCLLRHCISLT